MSLLQLCRHPGCTTRTIGGLCVEHEPVTEPREFPRGRPFPPPARLGVESPALISLSPQGVTGTASGVAT